MFIDKSITDKFLNDIALTTAADRDKMRVWFDNWLAKAAIENPGPWVDSIRPLIASLVDGLYFTVGDKEPVVHCRPIDNTTLTLLTRGSSWFNGIDQLNLKLWSVISTR